MYAVEKLSSYITRGVYTVSGPFHPFGGAVDIIVVQQKDGSFKSSPWYVQFGKFQGVLKTREKGVTICINGVEAGFHMYLDHKGEAYFLKDSDSGEGVDFEISPPSSGDEMDEKKAVHNSLNAANYTGDDPNPWLSIDDSVKESAGSDGEKLGDSLRPNVATEVYFEKIITHMSTSRTHEEILEVYTLETGDSGDSSKLISESVMIESDEYNISSQGSILDNFTDAAIPGPMADEPPTVASLEEKHDEEKKASSLSYTERLQSPTVTFDVSAQPQDTLSLSSGGGESLQEHICEVTSMPESEKSVDRENYGGYCNQDLELCRAEISSVFQDCHSPRNVAFQDISGNVSNAISPQRLSSSESEIIYQDRETSELSQGKFNRMEELDFIQNQCPVLEEEEASAPNCHVPIPNDISFISNEGQESKTFGNCVSGEEPCLQSGLKFAQDESKFPLLESLEDEQFQFSDIDSFSVKRTDSEVQVSNTAAEMEDSTLLKIEGDIVVEQDSDTKHEECFGSVSEVSGSQTSPLAIPRSTMQLGETELSAKSLPIIRSQIHDLERSNLLHPLSCSLDLNSDSFEQDLVKKEISNSSKLESVSGSDVIQDNCASQAPATAVDSENNQGHNVIPINSSVELSLCKHFLFEGMGADAASTVFETNKVNLEKFSTLGPSLLKNDKLVVRIGGHYFPWDAAAPIILGMLCFGQEQIFESQGMIDVDKDEKSGEPSGAITPSGGSWRLWPFSLKKSKTINTVRFPENITDQENVDAVPMISQSLMGHDGIQKAKFTKKKVQSLTPTSEELASLNLKEGRNVVTFSFSTAMLGQQQVDARIYLWKWNTRIVISDVDGTITKSDVLGQFMPLVGKDWSQTGVTHLFSAIKENGYQLLFLSARAISQAYLTRQFLFNLKQDGKALPDGPVVISPDGLFPSLYREVIRRAPHEFKISCLEDIRALFPPECNPFYAGFGNRDTDEISYLKVGVPKGKIFIINTKGEVAVSRRVDTKSYTSLHALVNGMFPPMSTAEQEDFNSWNYWRLPLPDVGI